MREEDKIRLKIFFWDQFVRPLYVFQSLSFLKILLLVLLFFGIAVNFPILIIFIIGSLLGIIFAYELHKYYKSGEFIYNYRKFNYKDYKKDVAKLKKYRDKDLIKQEISEEESAPKSNNIIPLEEVEHEKIQ